MLPIPSSNHKIGKPIDTTEMESRITTKKWNNTQYVPNHQVQRGQEKHKLQRRGEYISEEYIRTANYIEIE